LAPFDLGALARVVKKVLPTFSEIKNKKEERRKKMKMTTTHI